MDWKLVAKLGAVMIGFYAVIIGLVTFLPEPYGDGLRLFFNLSR
jgi:hypothetical protein